MESVQKPTNNAVEPIHAPPSDTRDFLEKYGYLYKEITPVGERVDKLFLTQQYRGDDANLVHFKPTLLEHPVCK